MASSSSSPPDRGATIAEAPPTTPAERRGLLLAGAVFFGALVALIALSALVAGDAGDEQTTATSSTEACAPDDAACRIAERSDGRPGIIPQPGEGRAPSDPGDRGGWAQVALLGLIVGAVGFIGLLIARGGRRARIAAPPTGAAPREADEAPPGP